MKTLLKQIYERAKKNQRKIVFVESEDERILKAVRKIAELGIAKPLLLVKSKNKIKNIQGVQNINVDDKKLIEKYAKDMHKARKKKGWTEEYCRKKLKDKNYFGTMMVYCGDAEGMISGAMHSTADTIRPALQIIKTEKKFHKVSGLFLMVLENKTYLFADCAVNMNPTSKELANIAVNSAETAKMFGIRPRVAMLSFSTHGSATDESVAKVRKATKLARKKIKYPIDGELQVDAAIVPEVAKKKSGKNVLRGQANVLIFPDLNSGNISYKLVERLAKAKAIGPILQGLKKPVNDLSRGCNVQDIVNLTAVTCVQTK